MEEFNLGKVMIEATISAFISTWQLWLFIIFIVLAKLIIEAKLPHYFKNKKMSNGSYHFNKGGIVSDILVKKNDNCPTCGGKLVQRSGKFGNFFGCSNYPNCKFTRKIVD